MAGIGDHILIVWSSSRPTIPATANQLSFILASVNTCPCNSFNQEQLSSSIHWWKYQLWRFLLLGSSRSQPIYLLWDWTAGFIYVSGDYCYSTVTLIYQDLLYVKNPKKNPTRQSYHVIKKKKKIYIFFWIKYLLRELSSKHKRI